MITLRYENCPICHSGNRRLLGRPGRISELFEKYSEISQVNIVRCADCTGKYIHPMMYFSPALTRELYGLDYFNANGAVEDFKNMGEKISIMAAVKKLYGDPRGKTMLDIGCGTGEFLKAGADAGFEVTGIDVERTTTEFVSRKYGFRTFTGLLEAQTFPSASFDVVVFSHVIEHLQEPIELLGIIRRILKPQGLLVMCTPNNDSLGEDIHNVYGRFRYGRSNSYYLTPFTSPYHIIGFNLSSSRRILEQSGFAVEYCKLRSGLEWEEKKRKFIMWSIKVTGAMLGKGMSIVTISRKPAAEVVE
jgi:2-polyprenyl-3-methyl-5-hydroxy-6-metoxy-1,4-benzoquinol methylase